MDETSLIKSIDDSELFRAFKAGRLKGPNALVYESSSWIEFTGEILNPTTRDIELLCSALHFGLELETLRSRMDNELPQLAPADAVDFVVAGLNIQTCTVISQTKKKLHNQGRKSDVAYLGNGGDIRIINSGNQSIDSDDMMANFVDGMANILYRVSNSNKISSSANRSSAISAAQKMSALISIEQGLKELWGRAAWEGYRIRKSDDCSIFESSDEPLAKLWLAWQRRFETIILQESRLQAGEALVRDDRTPRAPILVRTVLRLEERSGQKKEYVVGTARAEFNDQTTALSAIESTYLKSFLDEVLPKYRQTGLTYRHLWMAWWVFQDIVKLHQARMPRACYELIGRRRVEGDADRSPCLSVRRVR